MEKGGKLSKETKEKISKSLIGNHYAKGFKPTEETRKKISEANKGKHSYNKGIPLSDEVKRKISLSCKGGNKTSFKKGMIVTEETRKKLSLARRGKPFTIEHRKNMSGENHWNWQGGKAYEEGISRKSPEYKLWRKAVFERDNYQCIWGGKSHGNKLHADHIKPWSLFPELRFAIDNGRTLCEDCHRITDTYAGRIIKYKRNLS